MIILDTNVLSEPTRPAPSQVVRNWIAAQRQVDLFTTTITEAEMLWGVELLALGSRRDALLEQIRQIFDTSLAGRVLPFDRAAAHEFPAVTLARHGRSREPKKDGDLRIAAIVKAHGATLATRNTSDFERCGIDVVNPWMAGLQYGSEK